MINPKYVSTAIIRLMRKVIIVCGLPGCGKSTISEAIAKHFNLPIFSVDPIEFAIVKSGIEAGFETGLAAYMVAEALATEQLKLDQSVVIDSVSGVAEAKDMWRKLAQSFQARLVVIECFCSDENIQHVRIHDREKNLGDNTDISPSRLNKYKSEYVRWDEPHLALDATNDLDGNIIKAIEYIK